MLHFESHEYIFSALNDADRDRCYELEKGLTSNGVDYKRIVTSEFIIISWKTFVH